MKNVVIAAFDENGDRSTLQTVAGNGVSVFDVVYSMMSSDPRPSRRVVLMFREPWAHSPGFGRRANTFVEGNLVRVIGAAQEAHIATFIIGLEDLLEHEEEFFRFGYFHR